MHKPTCPALDPFANLLGDYGQCNCGGDDGDVLRGSERYLVETRRSGFDLTQTFPTYADARKFADSEKGLIGGDVAIWRRPAYAIQPPALPPTPELIDAL